MAEFSFGLIGDQGSVRHGGTLFYYDGVSTGPAVKTVAELVRSFQVSDIINLGDLTYDTGASTLYEDNNGQFFNDFMAPYPSPEFKNNGAYRLTEGEKIWPYDLYDYPNGFPHPVDHGLGGSKDGINRYWPTAGNHDYGLRVGYQETNVSVSEEHESDPDWAYPIGSTSTKVPQPFIDYFGWLANPSLLEHQTVNVGSADGEGYQGIYYSTELGTQDNGKPLIELFSIDTQRLLMNAGYHDALRDGIGPDLDDSEKDFYMRTTYKDASYDPTQNSNSDQLSPNEHKSNGYKQFQWLENGILNSEAKWKVIIGHHPVYGSAKQNRDQNSGYGSTPALQRLLKALPEGSVDAYFNGHAHYYQRVLESNNKGIGLGIPFVTLGNSGRGLYSVNESWYGDNIYRPRSAPASLREENKALEDYLLASDPINAGISGRWWVGDDSNDPYSYGFGAGSAKVDDSYFLFQYQQKRVLDPAISENLIGSSRNTALKGWGGLTQADWVATKEIDDEDGKTYLDPAELELTFSKYGYLIDATVEREGSGYMQSKGGSHTVDFEIRGNEVYIENQNKNPFDRAIVRLTFEEGELDTTEIIHRGSGYRNYVQYKLNDDTSYTPTKSESTKIYIHPFLDETWYMIKSQEKYFGLLPAKQSDSYKDWYLITDTTISAETTNQNDNIHINYSVTPKSTEAQTILKSNSWELPTGYSGEDAQNKYQTPQQGLLSLLDSAGTIIGSTHVKDGAASIRIKQLPKPGKLSASFSGDALSSYLVNFKPSTTSLDLKFGNWNSGISNNSKSFSLAKNTDFTISRTDHSKELISFGILQNDSGIERMVLLEARASSSQALDRDHLFDEEWTLSDWQTQGNSSYIPELTSGDYTPIAKDSSGKSLQLETVESHGNAIIASFEGGIEVNFTAQGTGILEAGSGNIDVSISRLGWNNNGLAFYEADPITGAIQTGNRTLLPGDTDYLSSALQLAKNSGTYLSASQLPQYKGSQTYDNLPLEASKNYGLLLLHSDHSNQLSSSYSQANLGEAVQMKSFYTPGRGITYGIEDLTLSNSDRDYNDLIVTLYADQPIIT